MTRTLAAIGECMAEIKPHALTPDQPHAAAQLGFGGDAMNFCIYLARLGVVPHFVTAMGDDTLSDWLVDQWQRAHVRCELVVREPGAVPGLYLIHTDEAGERSFLYWRQQAPVRRLFASERQRQRIFDNLTTFSHIYLSGITLALFDVDTRALIFSFLTGYRKAGGRVIFDNNYRPTLWARPEEAAVAFEQAYRNTDIALPTIDDEHLVFGEQPADAIIARLTRLGCREVALKCGPNGSVVYDGETMHSCAAATVERVVDTTSAGDSFNAGYIAGRLSGMAPVAAANTGHALAGIVVQHPGAIAPEDAITPLRNQLGRDANSTIA